MRERVIDREPINYHRGIVILENVPIGVCDRCGAHYYAATVMRRAEDVLTKATPPARMEQVPVAAFAA